MVRRRLAAAVQLTQALNRIQFSGEPAMGFAVGRYLHRRRV